MKILFIGDVFGRPGREALHRWLPAFREEHDVDFVIANGENAANGAGITSKIAAPAARRRRGRASPPATTSGGSARCISSSPPTTASCGRPTTRPAPRAAGSRCGPPRTATQVAVIDLAGELFMNTGMSPFRIVDRLVDEARALAETIVVDIHAEATSEKVAMGHYLDGRVTAVVGHAHARADLGRPRPARWHRLPHRRRDDRARSSR